MTDTSPEIAVKARAKLMALPNATRFVIGPEMFEAARGMLVASLPKGLTLPEFKQRLFERIYGEKLPF